MLRLVSFGMDYHWAIARDHAKEVGRIICDPGAHPDEQIDEPRGYISQATGEQPSSSRDVYFFKLPCIYPLSSFVHRWSHHHIQRLHVAGKLVSHYILPPGLTNVPLDTEEKYPHVGFDRRICRPLSRVSAHDGVHSPLHVHGSHQRHESLERVFCGRTQYGWLLEPNHRLA